MRLSQGVLILLLLLCLAGAALATSGSTLRYGGAGHGLVVFDGRTHIGRGYNCNDCHLELFTTQKKALITIRDHFNGASCFSCHDNKTASRDCASCHRSFPSQPMNSSPAMAQLQSRPLASGVDIKPLLEGNLGGTEQTRACLSCHGQGNLKPVGEGGKKPQINLDLKALAAGPHSAIACAVCHAGGDGKESFTQVPHKIDRAASPTCLSCHKESLASRIESFRQSVHYERLQGKVSCSDCHDAHTIQRKNATPESKMQAAGRMNDNCLACHTDSAKQKELSGRDMRQMEKTHSFLKWDIHVQAVMCVECHTAPNRGNDGKSAEHVLLNKEKALRDCAACHNPVPAR